MCAVLPTTLSTKPRLSPAVLVLFGIALLRLIYLPLFCAVTDLAGDESYYWEWGRRPDWGYFSKPPLIGWLMGIVGWLTGNSEWGVRLAALACGTASLYFLQALTRRMFGERAAVFALLLTALTPANAALNLFFTIDAPLVLCWSAALLAMWRCIESPDRASHWALLALAMGVGNLAKQMMLVFPALMLLLFTLTRELRPLLRRASLWWSLALSLLFLAPVLLWQQQHHWVTLGHMSHHFDAKAGTGVLEWLSRFASFPASQAGLFNPITWLLLMSCMFASLWHWRVLDPKQRFLTIFSAPALAVFLVLALRQNVNPNWPAVFYLSAMVLLAGWLAQHWVLTQPATRVKIAIAAAVTLLAYVLPLAVSGLGLSGHPTLDPVARVRGWKEAGDAAGALLARMPDPQHACFLALGHRDNASQLAFYTPQHPQVYRWQPDGQMASQYELWPSLQEERTGWDVLIFQPSSKPLAKSLQRLFESVEPTSTITIPLGHGSVREWQVFVGRKLKGLSH